MFGLVVSLLTSCVDPAKRHEPTETEKSLTPQAAQAKMKELGVVPRHSGSELPEYEGKPLNTKYPESSPHVVNFSGTTVPYTKEVLDGYERIDTYMPTGFGRGIVTVNSFTLHESFFLSTMYKAKWEDPTLPEDNSTDQSGQDNLPRTGSSDNDDISDDISSRRDNSDGIDETNLNTAESARKLMTSDSCTPGTLPDIKQKNGQNWICAKYTNGEGGQYVPLSYVEVDTPYSHANHLRSVWTTNLAVNENGQTATCNLILKREGVRLLRFGSTVFNTFSDTLDCGGAGWAERKAKTNPDGSVVLDKKGNPVIQTRAWEYLDLIGQAVFGIGATGVPTP